MFFRTKKVKGTSLVQLVESFRNAEDLPRQRVIASLGDAELPEGQQKQIARAVEMRLRGVDELLPLDLSTEAAAWVGRIVQIASRSKAVEAKDSSPVLDGVLVEQVETEQVVQYGPQVVALKAWDELGLSDILAAEGMNPGSISTAKLMVANRLIEPLSEWSLIDWAERTALPELLDLRITKTSKDRLYRTSDLLLKSRKSIESSLRQREKDLFSLRRSVVLYDVTNTHFEGLCEDNPKARHGKNKQHRNDCRQVAVGMAFDEKGFALAHEMFEGNMADTNTLGVMLDRLDLNEEEAGKPVVILDAGFASEKNIQLIEGRGCSYLINVTRGSRKKYAEFFDSQDFVPIPGRKPEDQVEVKTIPDPEHSNRQLVLCRSLPRRDKEVAMLSKAEERFLSNAKALRQQIEKGQIKQPEVIQRKIGALMQKHPRVARFYTVEHTDQTLTLNRQDESFEESLDLCGDYVIKTDRSLAATELWTLYMTLLKAERGFRMLKGSLGLRPNFHHLEGRVDGHVFISVLAYHLLCWISCKLEQSGDRREWKTIRRLLRTHSLASTRFPLKDGRIVSVRKPTIPDAEQEQVYRVLGIDWRAAFPRRRTEIRG